MRTGKLNFFSPWILRIPIAGADGPGSGMTASAPLRSIYSKTELLPTRRAVEFGPDAQGASRGELIPRQVFGSASARMFAQLSEFSAVMKETAVMPSLSSSLILPRFSSSSESVLSDAVSKEALPR